MSENYLDVLGEKHNGLGVSETLVLILNFVKTEIVLPLTLSISHSKLIL